MEGQVMRNRRRFHAGNIGGPFQCALYVVAAPRLVVSLVLYVERDQSQVRRIESGIDADRVPQAAREQSRAGKRDQREGNLYNHQKTARLPDAAQAARCAAAFLEVGRQVRVGAAQGRYQSK